jgi:RNA recognition motif-containing protein
MAGISVALSPLFDDRKNIVAFIEDNGFMDYTGFQLYEDYCFITFPEFSIAQRFVETMNGIRTNGCKLSARIVSERSQPRWEEPSPRPRPRGVRSKTVAVRNYPAVYLGDRNLWNDFRETGFIRQIEVRRPTGYIQFDSEEDAIHAVEEMDGKRLNGSRITVEMIPDRILNLPNVVVQLIHPDAAQRERSAKEQPD